MIYQELLEEVIASKAKYGEQSQPPCPAARLEDLRRRVRENLDAELPTEYAEFLRAQDGLNWNGLFVYASETSRVVGTNDAQIQGFVEANLNFRDDDFFRDYLVFGDGNMDLYVQHLPSGEYQVIDRVPGNLIESHPSFDSLLAAAIKAHL